MCVCVSVSVCVCVHVSVCVFVAKPVAVELRCHATALIAFGKSRFSQDEARGRTGLVVRASDSGSGDPGSILGLVGVLFP